MKIKVDIYGDEGFPIYDVSTPGQYSSTILEIDEEIFDKWKAAFDTFSEVQEEITKEMKKQGYTDKIWGYADWVDGGS